jgi:2-phosphoglycerate kinase
MTPIATCSIRRTASARTREKQLQKYFEEVEIIRKFVRNAETDSLPMLEDIRVEPTKGR